MTRPLTPYLFALSLVILVTSAGAQEKSAKQRAWESSVGKKQQDNPAYAYVDDDPALPRVLIIGDSISIGYTARVREKLAGKANVHRIPTNGGDTNRGKANLNNWLGKTPWDVIHANWGLHDIKRMTDGKMDASADRQVAPETYAANLRELTQRLKDTGATIIWANTTPVPEGAQGRIPGDEVAYNTAAQKIMEEQDIVVNDLYHHVNEKLSSLQRPANVHFTDAGSVYLGDEVARHITMAIPTP